MCVDKKCRNIYSMELTNIISKTESDLNALLNKYDSAFKENRLNYNMMYKKNSSLTKIEDDIDLLMKNLIQDSYQVLEISIDEDDSGSGSGSNSGSSSSSATGEQNRGGEDANNDSDDMTVVERSQDVVFSRSEDMHFGYMRELIYFYTCIVLCFVMVGFFMYELNKSTGIIDNVANKATQSLKNINNKSQVNNQLPVKDNKLNNVNVNQNNNKNIGANNNLLSRSNKSNVLNNINSR